ncbi:desulfoferrodoxin family protein [Clostridium felsineum]|uniref:Desulfoferrodoxin n=1 Tax=Clostridium felsineum TaxID=36839 RepID=A0A1S8LBS2_9CLOT|nr:desulfoferrodoxin family protein [Clostridium felsineum]MCR3761922.1 desulfoferrodoxin FeS4 iron-binding domain-containing protein [Clostridium felsineum]URZ07339.1 Desulfoferrodoxin [Clostridium felsineum]URZ12370.1 Desulfoferrodoxin [Clostridium felsineum]URZ17032.1 Desulfoferrodoxin [Clostridium felsineum DSM 794]
MNNDLEIYICKKCGNAVLLIEEGGGTLTCCSEPMTKITANTTDAAQEKHVPHITKNGSDIDVSVGSVEHPMTPEHFIQWIVLVSGDRMEMVKLSPDKKPTAHFKNVTNGTIYAYCNLHSLWKADI